MFEPLFGFTTATHCTGLTDKLFFDEKPQLARVKGTTKKAEAFGRLSQFLHDAVRRVLIFLA